MKILVAEHLSVDRNFLQDKFEDLGHTVMTAGDGLKAWEIFQKNKIEMVIADLAIPQMDGLSLCRKIRSATKNDYVYIIAVAAASVKDKQKEIDKILKEDADAYITRSFDSQQLLDSVRTGERVLQYEKKHKKMQNVLMASRSKFKVIIDSLQEEIVSIDKTYRIISANRAFQKNSGFPFNELIGKQYFSNTNKLFSVCCKETTACLTKHTQKAWASGLPQNYLDVAKDKHGQTKYRRFSWLPIVNDAGGVFQVVILSQNVTDRMQKIEEIESLNKKLQQAIHQIQKENEKLKTTQSQFLLSEKMVSVGQLVAGIAHEINNPVGFVIRNLRTLSDYQNDINKLLGYYKQLISNLKGTAKDLPFSTGEEIDQIATLEKEMNIDFILDDVMNLIGECKDGTERVKKIVLDLKNFVHPDENNISTVDIKKEVESTLNVVWNEIK